MMPTHGMRISVLGKAVERGGALIEILVALLLLLMLSTTVTRTLVFAHRMERQTRLRTTAIELATEGLERARTGERDLSSGLPRGFARTVRFGAATQAPGLQRIDVTVRNDREDLTCTLSTLAGGER